MRTVTGSVWLLVTLSVAVSSLHAGGSQEPQSKARSAQWGTLSYPLLANIRSEEGTFLCHFRIDEDLSAAPGQWFQAKTRGKPWYRFVLAGLQINDSNRLTIFWKFMKRGNGAMWTGNSLPGNIPNLTDRSGMSRHWRRGQDHVAGYAWDRKGFHSFWLDGQLAARHASETPALGLGAVDHRKGRLTLGSQRDSAITILGVHILTRPLGPEAMKQPSVKLFSMTDDTMLLDLFDCRPFIPDGKKQTQAVFISGFSGEKGGTPSGACRFVETEKGSGLRLYCPRSGEQ